MRIVIVALCGTLAAGWPLERVSAQMVMSGMLRAAGPPLGIPENRMGSGTSWLPDDAPMQAIHVPLGAWTVMAHAAVYVALRPRDTNLEHGGGERQ